MGIFLNEKFLSESYNNAIMHKSCFKTWATVPEKSVRYNQVSAIYRFELIRKNTLVFKEVTSPLDTGGLKMP